MRQGGSATGVFLAGIAGVLVGSGLLYLLVGRAPQRTAAVKVDKTYTPAARFTTESQDAIEAAIAKVGPSVVNIDTLITPRSARQDPLLRDQAIPSQAFPEEGEGSGVIIDGKNGYILTNAHVVRDAAKIRVTLVDGRNYSADVVGHDLYSDVAVVKVPASDLPSATLGDPDAVPIGAWLIAIGNPFGFQHTATVGVLSARDRQIQEPNGVLVQELLQTDAAINPGNSGGALADIDGNVIGLPTAIVPYAEGIGFAVSMNVARRVADEIIRTGKMQWPWLGVSTTTLTQARAAELGLAAKRGALVLAVQKDSPAAQARLEPNDVIAQVGITQTKTAEDLVAAIRTHKPGQDVSLKVWRGGKEITVTVRLGVAPSAPVAPPPPRRQR